MYKVYRANGHGEIANELPVFKAMERSSCCQRNFCLGSRRAFEIFISSSIPLNPSDLQYFDNNIFIRLKRPY